MLEVAPTPTWKNAYPGAFIGLLEVSGVDNRLPSPALAARKIQVEDRLRQVYAGFTRPDFIALPVLSAYREYYKKFDMTYHVQLQLELLVLKGKSLPAVSPLVDANFSAELETLVLTAGHDADLLFPPVTIDVTAPGDEFVQMNGTLKALRPADMCMKDTSGIVCTILYGQDNHSPITPATTHALYVAYAPAGVNREQVELHLTAILANIRLFAPRCSVAQLGVLSTG